MADAPIGEDGDVGAGRGGGAGGILAWGQAVRAWSPANPEGFRLIYGDPVAGYHAPEGGPAPEAAKRACLGLTELAAAAWPHAKATQADTGHQWSDFSPAFAGTVREHFPDLPPAAVALALRLWGRMHGLISLEVYGHLGPQINDPAKLYRAELLDLVRSLGLGAPSEGVTAAGATGR